MKITTSAHGRAPRAFALVAALALVSNNFTFASAQTTAAKASAQKLTEGQRVVHVLNRLAFGARPGEVERVRKLGVEAYIEQQLNPSKLDDSALEARLRNFPTLGMSNGELLAKYPQPGQLLKRLERAGELPPELAALVRQRNQGQPQDEYTPNVQYQVRSLGAVNFGTAGTKAFKFTVAGKNPKSGGVALVFDSIELVRQ